VNVSGRCQAQTVKAYNNQLRISKAQYNDLQTLARKLFRRNFMAAAEKVPEPYVGDCGEESN